VRLELKHEVAIKILLGGVGGEFRKCREFLSFFRLIPS